MGLRHGREQGEVIGRLVGAYESFLGAERLSRVALQDALAHPEAFLDEDALEEIRGLAEGTGIPTRHLIAYNVDAALFTEYGPLRAAAVGCAQAGFAARRHRAPGVSGPLHAVNEDSALAVYLKGTLSRVVQVRRPARGAPHVLFSFPGQVGGLNGANARGLVATSCVLLDRMRPAAVRPGLVHGVLIRRILEEAPDTSSALAVARALPRRGAWSVLLSHAREADLACFEYDDGGWTEKPGLERHLASNHARLSAAADVPEHSRHRLERLEEILGGETPTVGVDELKSALRDRFDRARGRAVAHPTMSTVCRVDNVMGLVVDVGAGRLWVTEGPGGASPDPAWVAFHLPSLLATPDAAATPGAQDPVMARHVVRIVDAPLAGGRPAGYRPGRLLVVGGGPVACALAARMEARGTRVDVVPVEAGADTAVAEAAARLDGGAADLCLLSGLTRAGGAADLPTAAEWQAERGRLVEVPYHIAQLWAGRIPASVAGDAAPTLSAITALGGDLGYGNLGGACPEGGALLGLLKALRREVPGIRVKALDTEPGEDAAAIASAWLDEMDGGDGRVEVGLLRGRRRVPLLLPAAARTDVIRLTELRALRSVVLTGGARGITAEAALALARAGVKKLHLLGRTALGPRLESWRELSARGPDALAQDVLARLRRERGRVSPVEWQDALAPIERALEVDRTLRRLAADGTEVAYHTVDVSDGPALAIALEAVRRQDGPIEAIVHGAGFERSRAFTAKSVEDLEATLAPKVDGLLNLLELTSRDPLRLLVAFSSVSGRFGGLGQADYSLANDLMARLLGRYAFEHPRCHAVAACWPAWDATGMSARGDTRSRLLAAGQGLMPPVEGAQHFLAEAVAAGGEIEVTFTDGNGGLDADGTLPPDHRSPARRKAGRAAAGLALSDVVVESGADRVAIECALDADRDVFLHEHRRKGQPLLPAVALLEVLAECGFLAGGEAEVELADVTIEAPFKVAPGRRATLRARASASADGWALAVSADVLSAQGRLLESDRPLARARTPRSASALPACPDAFPPFRRFAFAYPDGNGGDAIVHHGPALRGLREVAVGEADLHEARLVVLPAPALRPHLAATRWLVPAAALDACLQACSAVARARLGVLALPVAFGRVWITASPSAGEECRVVMRLREEGGETVRFDFWLLAHDGRLALAAEDYRARPLASLARASRPALASSPGPAPARGRGDLST